MDKFDFDPEFLNLNIPYKYAISQDFFEMTIFLEEKNPQWLLNFFLINRLQDTQKNGESRHIEFFYK
ncbi:hypothetical protein CVT17_03420 [Campylobacter concisus]|uniref:Uncharacterized protein n=1 Tax=Campylobacter concisus TaxID=199 RepID=A0AAE7P0J1_9BACT|nr:hypothetical protein CVT17_03420 [Campylobacter concisus]